MELATLCDPRVRAVLAEQRIQLIGFRDLGRAGSVGGPEGGV